MPDNSLGRVAVSSSHVDVGWTIGGGIEWAWSQNWSFKAEYLYFDLPGQTVTLDYAACQNPGSCLPGNAINYRFDQRGQIVRGGVNYKFDWGKGPVAARY